MVSFWVSNFFSQVSGSKDFSALGFWVSDFFSYVSRSKDFPASGFWFLDFFGFNGLRFLGPWFIG